jgi:hypothetical protein
MRVTIEHQVCEGGLVFKTVRGYWVNARCELTAEERAIVDARKLWDYIVVKKKNPFWQRASERDRALYDEWFQYSIAGFVKGTKSIFETPSQAKDFSEELREDLQKLKNFISGNAELGKNQTFDL